MNGISSTTRLGAAAAGILLMLIGGCTTGPGPASDEAGRFVLRSPDGRLEVGVSTRGQLTYSVLVDGQRLLAESRLGLALREGASLGAEAEVAKAERTTQDATWENRWGKRRQVRDHYNQLRLVLRPRAAGDGTFEILFRAYDDGVAFRYIVGAKPGAESLILDQETTEFTFASDYQCFAGQQEKGFQGAQEWEFKPSRLSEVRPESIIGLPLLVQTPTTWVALTEADLRDWSGLWLAGGSAPAESGGGVTLAAKLAPRKDGQGLVRASRPHASPWRAFIIGRQPGRLIESDLVLNLSTPCQLADVSWVRPGKMAWDHWWSGDVKMDTSTLKDYIALASEMGWPYQLIDWQWYGPFNTPESDLTKVNPAVDMEEVRKFAKERGVRLWFWLYWSDVDRNDAYKKAFALYEQWGIAGVKIDFMDRDDQEMVNWYEKITKAAAEHHLMVNFHGAFKTSGFNRTFPNQVTREGILGNEYNRWSTRVTPEHKLMLPFTRFLAGPADFTPGGFLNRQPAQFKADANACEVQGTRAAELALFVTYDSPLCCVCDHPSHYNHQRGAGFLKVVPTTWDDTKVLEGEPGKHLLIARRSGEDWFLGALTDREAREVTVSLDFLKSGRWKTSIWKDAADANVNAEHLETEERFVTAVERLKISLAPAGGFVAWLRRP